MPPPFNIINNVGAKLLKPWRGKDRKQNHVYEKKYVRWGVPTTHKSGKPYEFPPWGPSQD
jgi:hypothetical protein